MILSMDTVILLANLGDVAAREAFTKMLETKGGKKACYWSTASGFVPISWDGFFPYKPAYPNLSVTYTRF